MKLLKIFKTYDCKTLKENKILLSVSILSLVITIATMLSIQLISNSYIASINHKLDIVNGGDINIQSETKIFDSEDYELLNELQNKNIIRYSLSLRELTNITTETVVENGVVNYIEYSNYNITDDNIDYSSLSDSKNVILTEKLAENLNVNVGDQVFLKTYNDGDNLFTVSKIIKPKSGISLADTEIELTEDILGIAYIGFDQKESKIQNYNTAYIDIVNKDDTDNVKNIFKEHFNEKFIIRDKNDLMSNVKGRVDLQINGIKLIGVISYIISGIGICVIFNILILKRQKDFVIFRVLGIRKWCINILVLLESSIIGIISCCIGLPLGFLLSSYLGKIYGSFSSQLNISHFLQAGEITIIVFLGIFVFSIIPLLVLNRLPINTIFREEKVTMGGKIRLFFPILLIIALISFLCSLYVKSYFGIIFVIGFFIIGALLYALLNLSLKLISLIRRLLNNMYFLVFINLERQRNSIALSSVSFILGLFLLGVIVNITSNLLPGTQKINIDEKNNTIILETSKNYANNVDNILKNRTNISGLSKFYITKASLQQINDKNMNYLIDERYWTGGLAEEFKKYCNEIPIYGYDMNSNSQIGNMVEGRWFNQKDVGKNYIVISSDYLQSIVTFSTGDKLRLSMNGKTEDFEVIGIQQPDESLGLNCFAYVTDDVLNLGDNTEDLNNIQSVNYVINFDERLDIDISNTILKTIPNVLILNVGNLGRYINDFIDNSKSLFIYTTILCITSGIFLLISNQYISFLKRKNELMLMNILGASRKKIFKIYMLESFILGLLNGFFAVCLCELVSRFVIEVMMQQTYYINIFLGALIIFTSILIIMGSTIIVLFQSNIKKMYLNLRENI